MQRLSNLWASMLDPRLYRTGAVAVALAVIVVAFSLVDQQRGVGSSLAPDAFNGAGAFSQMVTLAKAAPNRRPGSAGDEDVASVVASTLRSFGYSVSQQTFRADTVDGRHPLLNVVGTRTGLAPGAIVVVSHRDSLSSPGTGELSGTAAMLELARVLAGQTQQHTIVLASTSGAAGTAGARELARTLPGPIDAVISLGDLASLRTRSPIVIPWSTGPEVAPAMLRQTVAGALAAQAGLPAGSSGLAGQLAHLVLPITPGEQGPFGARGIPAVEISLGGDQGAASGAALSAEKLSGTGRAILQSVGALDGAASVPRAVPYLLLSGKVVPKWAISVLVLALLVPVLLVAVDGLARVRRRGHGVGAGMLRALGAALPFLAAAALAIAAHLTGVLESAPPGPVPADGVRLSAGGIGVLAVAVLLITGGLTLWWRLRDRSARGPDPALGVGALLVMCLATVALCLINPFAALVAIPALHLWLWLFDAALRPHPLLALGLLVGGFVVPLLVALDMAVSLHLGPGGVIWTGVLLVAGGALAPGLVVIWSVLLGCTASVVALGVEAHRAPRPQDAPVTVRGPVTYAGPGSLGGTESALRR